MNKKIVLDAGHGGIDSGAISVSPFELHESEVNMDIVEKLHDILVAKRYDVICTREADVYVSLPQRLRLIDEVNPDIFVSIHCNASENPNANGTETIFRDPEDEYLATLIQESLVEAIHTKNRGTRNDLLYLKKKLMVLSNVEVPSCLVEVAFISNPKDAITLLDITGIAEGIAVGITKWFDSKLPVT
jgi:N-acetylmuramoyl-L-alanine amidase